MEASMQQLSSYYAVKIIKFGSLEMGILNLSRN